MHKVLVNRLGGLSLPRKSKVRLTDHPDMTLDVCRGCKTTMQQQQQQIRILAKAVLQISCSQGCFYTKCLCPKRGVTQPKIYGIGSKLNQFIYTLVCNYMPNIRILAKAVLKIFCSQGCSYTIYVCPKRGITQPKIYRIGSEVNQFIYILVCNYMPNIRILALAVFQIFC